ncbi:MAG: inner membrane CreD family protein [Spirochaetia bacterium]|nr:inner membrane CreD family protein [Spirochaetia bacterium]
MFRISVKIAVLGVLGLLLLIPPTAVCALAKERSDRRAEALSKISGIWGGRQSIIVPVAYSNGMPVFAASASIEGEMKTEVRYRGIFRIPVYHGKALVTVDFSGLLPGSRLVLPPPRPGLRITRATVDGIPVYFYEVRRERHEAPESVEALLPRGGGRLVLEQEVEGSEEIRFVPTARQTDVTLISDWPHPSFSGGALPKERTVHSGGFTSHWVQLRTEATDGFYRNIAGVEIDDESAFFGVSLFVPVDLYQLVDRALKYAALFISLTFMTFFFFEIMSSLEIHPIQYLFVGLAIGMFFLLLLALAEHIGFPGAFAVATASVIALIGTYSAYFLGSWKRTAVLSLLLLLLYGFLYVVLQLEMFALLVGSLGLFVILAAAMMLTRHVQWGRLERQGAERAA